MTTKSKFEGLSQQILTEVHTTIPPNVTRNVQRSDMRFSTVIVGGYLPNWKARLIANQNATTNLDVSGKRVIAEWGTCGVKTANVWSPANFNGTAVGFATTQVTSNGWHFFSEPNALFAIFSTTARDQALARFYKDARSRITQFQGGVFLGELKESLKMLTHPAKTLRRGLNDYLHTIRGRYRRMRRRGRIPRPARINDMVADTWLEYQYGWKPLANDIEDAAVALLSKDYRDVQRVNGRSSEKAATVHPSNRLQIPGTHIWYMSHSVTTHTREYHFYGAVGGTVANPAGRAPVKWGIGLSDFVPTMWELIPYSFLVDYFSNIGDVIEAYSFCKANVLWMSETRHDRALRKWTGGLDSAYIQASLASAYRDPVYRSSWGSPGPASCEQVTIARRPIYGPWPLPSVHFELPGFGTKWINMAALLNNTRRTSRTLTNP